MGALTGRRMLAVAACAVSTLVPVAASPLMAASVGPSTLAAPVPFAHVLVPRPGVVVDRSSTTPPTEAYCELYYGYPCYDPAQFRVAYNLDPLYAKGDNGKGETIVIVDSFGSPTIKSDLTAFDNGWKPAIPAPPSFNIITPEGAVPKWEDTSAQVDWAQETSLDVEYAHAMAPGANILLVETPVNETEGKAGFPQIVAAENYVLAHKLGQVISQSFGATEETFAAGQINSLRSAYTAAQTDGVTVVSASGDGGATDYSNVAGTLYYTRPVDSWPSTDPLVTSVGGLELSLNQAGAKTAPPQVWNDTAEDGSPAAGGGGVSEVFARPSFQSGVSSVVGSWRGTPDVAMSAAFEGSALVYMSAEVNGTAGFVPIAGTSEATPQFAGVIAVADQVAGKSLGYLNPALYAMGAAKDAGLVDVTRGNNTVTFSQSGKTYTVNGYKATTGYDLASGWGMVNAVDFVPELIAAVAKDG